MCEPRTYRHWIKDSDLVSFSVVVKQTNLYIRAQRDLNSKALKSVLKHRTSPIGNSVKSREDISGAIEKAQGVKNLHGIVIIKGDEIGIWGKVKLVPLN